MSKPTPISDILPGIMKEVDAGRAERTLELRLIGKQSQIEALEESVKQLCEQNAQLYVSESKFGSVESMYQRLASENRELLAIVHEFCIWNKMFITQKSIRTPQYFEGMESLWRKAEKLLQESKP